MLIETVIRRIDFKLLREQKEVLSSIPALMLSKSQDEAILGVLSLLDFIQDAAVENLGVPEEEVFGEYNDN